MQRIYRSIGLWSICFWRVRYKGKEFVLPCKFKTMTRGSNPFAIKIQNDFVTELSPSLPSLSHTSDPSVRPVTPAALSLIFGHVLRTSLILNTTFNTERLCFFSFFSKNNAKPLIFSNCLYFLVAHISK